MGDVLASDAPSILKLRGALDEIGKTYRAVSFAILSFKKPAAQPTISADAFLELEGSDLSSMIAAGRGHCHNIDNYYYGGLRDALRAKVNEAELTSVEMDNIDATFQMLAQGDMDLFQPLEQIGELLSNESRAVVTLLLAGQQDAARQRILEGRTKLQPRRIHLFLLNSLEKLRSGVRIIWSHGENLSILPSRTKFTVTSEPSRMVAGWPPGLFRIRRGGRGGPIGDRVRV